MKAEDIQMNREDIVRKLLEGKDGCRVRPCVKIPEITYNSLNINRCLCRQNRCGNYNKSHTCPPNCGSEEYCIERVNSYKDADVIMRTFDDVDITDADLMIRITGEFSDLCREVMVGCRKAGFDVMALADGPCRYCDECSFLKGKKCPYPDMQVPSVSGYGVDMGRYIPEIGETFSFEKNRVTFYGIILFR